MSNDDFSLPADRQIGRSEMTNGQGLPCLELGPGIRSQASTVQRSGEIHHGITLYRKVQAGRDVKLEPVALLRLRDLEAATSLLSALSQAVFDDLRAGLERDVAQAEAAFTAAGLREAGS